MGSIPNIFTWKVGNMRLVQRERGKLNWGQRGAPMGTRALPSPGVLRAGCRSPVALPALPFQFPRHTPSDDVRSSRRNRGPEREKKADAAGQREGKGRRVPRPSAASRRTSQAALGSTASLSRRLWGHLRQTPEKPHRGGMQGLGGNKRHHLCHGETQAKTISSPRFPQPSS